ncbi:MAG: pilus assembly protein [Caulobacteraceae bacterium]|nr:pilus assembly protein [Caulobacter sp.]
MRRRSGRSARFASDLRGATAIEFAVLALPFVLAMLAVAEYGYVYLIDVSLDNALSAAARQVRTGQAQTAATTDPTTGKSTPAPVTQKQFAQMVCSGFTWVNDCEGNLKVASEVEASFGQQTAAAPLDSSGELRGDLPFSMGQPGDVVLVRAFYPWRMITPGLWTGVSAPMSQNRVLLAAGSIVMNEPYGSSS